MMHSLNLIAWALDLKKPAPLVRLAALFLADRGKWVIADQFDDPLMTADVAAGAAWVGCSDEEFVASVALLRHHGLLLDEVRGGAVTFRIPLGDGISNPVVEPQTVKAERQISVYVISAGGRSKVGISADPANRLYGLQGANPLMKLVLEFTRSGPSSMIRRIERTAHARLASHAIGNEWFTVTPAEAIAVVAALFDEGAE